MDSQQVSEGPGPLLQWQTLGKARYDVVKRCTLGPDAMSSLVDCTSTCANHTSGSAG